MSQEVLEGQQWLNSTYGSKSGYIRVPETGVPGTAMSQALVSAMQIELGISPITGFFGPLTSNMCDSYPLKQGDYGNRVKIVQYGLHSKGYNPGLADASMGSMCVAALRQIQQDAGLADEQSSDSVNGRQAQAILGVDEYKLVASGDSLVREQQQWLNRTYLAYTGICACDGIYSRSTSKALVYALQAEEGMPTSMANGNFGPSTKKYCPSVGASISGTGYNGSAYSSAKREAFLKLAQIALYCNGIDRYTGNPTNRYGTTALDGVLTSGTLQALHEFQADYLLPQKNGFELDEWMALLVSTGNPDRNATACDCSTQLTTVKATALKNAGYSIVGRYLTGTVGAGSSKRPKNLTVQEAHILFGLGLRFFAIYQDDADWWQNHDSLREYFSYERGYADARKAVKAALSLGIKNGEFIYFAVDFDYMAEEVIQRVVPHFQGINDYIASVGNSYRIGIYGSRNTCGIVWGKELSESSFVSDMSTGYSGNLGFPIPLNWAFDQIKEYDQTSSEGTFGVDKNVASGRYAGINTLAEGSSIASTDLTFKRLVGDKRWGIISDVNWDDNWFSSSGHVYNHALATTAASLSTLAYSDFSTIMTGLSKFGFSPSTIQVDVSGEKDPIGYSLATKTLPDNTPLVVVSIRGTANEVEWLSNMNVSGGATSIDVHLGFKNAAQSVRAALHEWLIGQEITPSSAKYLINGHSRGAAVANLLTQWLSDLDDIPSSQIFSYAFATPNVLVSPKSSANIFNIINPEDFVPRIPLGLWGFGKNGSQLVLPSLSNMTPETWPDAYLPMRRIYRSLTGTDHLAFVGGTKETDGFQSNLEAYAPTILDYYTTKGLSGHTPRDLFVILSRYVSGTADVSEFLSALSSFPNLAPYFIINGLFNPSIFPGHTPEAYLAWMKSQANPEELFR